MEKLKKYDDPVRQRLHDFMEFEGLNENSFRVMCGLSRAWWSSPGTPSGRSLSKIHATFPKLNMQWVYTGIGQMYFDSEIQSVVHNTITQVKQPHNLALFGDHQTIASQLRVSEEKKPEVKIENTQPAPEPTEPMITIPRSLLDSLQAQLAEKDKQIANLLAILAK